MVGFCAAGLAFGRVASVLQSIEALLARDGPATRRRSCAPSTRPRDSTRLEPLVHRWIRGRDLRGADADPAAHAAGARVDRGVLPRRRRSGRARRARRARVVLDARARDRPRAPPTAAPAGARRRRLLLSAAVRPAAPASGSTCFSAGWCGATPSTWASGRAPSPSRLVVPLDTHVIRLGRCLRLTRYVSPGWKMAAEITASLRAIDAADPVRYDFSLCHVGHDERVRLQPRRSATRSARFAACANRAFVNRGRLLDHPLDGEPRARPRQRRPRPCAAAAPASFSSSTMRSAIASGSRGGTRKPVSPSTTTSGMPPAVVATAGLRRRHRVHERRAQPLGHRAHREDVEALGQLERRCCGSRPGTRAARGACA